MCLFVCLSAYALLSSLVPGMGTHTLAVSKSYGLVHESWELLLKLFPSFCFFLRSVVGAGDVGYESEIVVVFTISSTNTEPRAELNNNNLQQKDEETVIYVKERSEDTTISLTTFT